MLRPSCQSILATIDRERGNCLLLYADDIKFAFGILDEEERGTVLKLFFKWFLGEEVRIDVDTPATRVYLALKQKQMDAVSKYIRGLEATSERAKLREASKKERLRGMQGVSYLPSTKPLPR